MEENILSAPAELRFADGDKRAGYVLAWIGDLFVVTDNPIEYAGSDRFLARVVGKTWSGNLVFDVESEAGPSDLQLI